METFERACLDAYFSRIASRFTPTERPAAFLITHLLPERPAFVRGVGAVTELRAVLPKPKSVHEEAVRQLEGDGYACDNLTRELSADPDRALRYIEARAAGRQVVLLDVGGYFTPALDALCDRFSGQILGVVEDTENGHRRYADHDKLPCPVLSVARSPLKDPEDFLVGQSVVFSTEALMRGRGDILHGRTALVIGFGKLGSSIARLLHAKGIRVSVYDIDPVRRTQALSQGFTVARDRAGGLEDAGLVLCATGSLSLRGEDFARLRNGAYVATVTSSEDELELAGLPNVYERATIGDHVTRYLTTGHYFYLLNGGNAVNFLHGASVGPFIFLVQAEILAASTALARGGLAPGLHELPPADRATIAATWLDYFNR
ncbi:adenosylhomocysteinase [Streptomyces sp. NBC_01381]|uniref:adenosylhomocysteinase n=1 Tax=Streptomyces sp. NBC_01381 TaxID=2903845 RepID=UPI0022553621|nr:adenosylhomocysteinase [Streptomyces sp. NBC_01381]MCX4665625.1 adenosylhomocysteinase [Streptomyces sp. NBC_01381]